MWVSVAAPPEQVSTIRDSKLQGAGGGLLSPLRVPVITSAVVPVPACRSISPGTDSMTAAGKASHTIGTTRSGGAVRVAQGMGAGRLRGFSPPRTPHGGTWYCVTRVAGPKIPRSLQVSLEHFVVDWLPGQTANGGTRDVAQQYTPTSIRRSTCSSLTFLTSADFITGICSILIYMPSTMAFFLRLYSSGVM